MGKSSDKKSLPQVKTRQTKVRAMKGGALVGSHCDHCGGATGPGMALFVCVPIGGGAYVWQQIPNPPVGGAHGLTIENGIIFWRNLNPVPIPEAVGPKSVMRRTRRPKGKRK